MCMCVYVWCVFICMCTDTKNLVSILISSDFLQMDKLVRESLEFFKVHTNEILAFPIGMMMMMMMMMMMVDDDDDDDNDDDDDDNDDDDD